MPDLILLKCSCGSDDCRKPTLSINPYASNGIWLVMNDKESICLSVADWKKMVRTVNKVLKEKK